jgi:hypothetical protein
MKGENSMAILRTWLLIFLCLMLNMCGCDSNERANADEERLFIEIYTQLSLVAQEHWDRPDDLAAAQEAIFAQTGVTREQYGDLTRRLKASPERWTAVWERIVTRLEKAAEPSQEAPPL